jgi:UDP-N-acetylglucosamine 2-epimerase (non-hydrolysing)
MEAFEPVLYSARPDWVVVVGDVNSTLACALVTAKLRHALGCRLAHVEAGLRSRNWSMPEEVNRVLTDRLSDLLLTPSRDANDNLRMEGIREERIVFVGNVMIDTLLAQLPKARELNVQGRLGLEAGNYAVVTLHRPSNVDDPHVFREILKGLASVAQTMPVVFPVHPRTAQNARDFGLGPELGRLRSMPPVGYLEMVGLLEQAAVVLTDSGGVQEETTVLGVPCLTLREQTERPVTVTEGTNKVLPWPPTMEAIERAVRRATKAGGSATGTAPEGWDGAASSRIVDALADGTTVGEYVSSIEADGIEASCQPSL